MIIENSAERIKVTDSDDDSLIVHSVQADGSVIITCHDGGHDEYAAVRLTDTERLALIARLTARVDELVAAIDAIPGDDPETAHSTLDDLVMEQMPNEVRAAALRLRGRCRWWASS